MMSDKSKKDKERLSKTGAIPRIEIENQEKQPPTETVPQRPKSLPEFPEDGASTGVIRIVSEGPDVTAEGDDDPPGGH